MECPTITERQSNFCSTASAAESLTVCVDLKFETVTDTLSLYPVKDCRNSVFLNAACPSLRFPPLDHNCSEDSAIESQGKAQVPDCTSPPRPSLAEPDPAVHWYEMLQALWSPFAYVKDVAVGMYVRGISWEIIYTRQYCQFQIHKNTYNTVFL